MVPCLTRGAVPTCCWEICPSARLADRFGSTKVGWTLSGCLEGTPVCQNSP
nr:hypothetical protein [uncultured bacterium]